MREFIHSLMTDKIDAPAFVPIKFILYLASIVYGVGLMGRRLLYNIGIFRSEKVPLKIISVGNLTLGGTGKTPFVIRLVSIMDKELHKPVTVLIRGYGWDEQNMLKKKLPDTPILVGSDRVRSAHKAIKLYGSDTAILDDGFQYWELRRNLDIVLVDSGNPFGNGCLFPRGILREPKDAVKRASVVVFTKVDKKISGLENTKSELLKINPGLAFVESLHKPVSLYDYKARKEYPLAFLKGKRVVLLSSIGDPEHFEETARSLGADVAEHIIYGDHHNYSGSDAERIVKRCNERSFDFILTTEKDEVKLRRMSLSFANYIVVTLVIDLEITNGKELLVDRLRRLYSR